MSTRLQEVYYGKTKETDPSDLQESRLRSG